MFIAPGWLRIIRMQSSLRIMVSCGIAWHEFIIAISASDMLIRRIIAAQPELFIRSLDDIAMHEFIIWRSAADIVLWFIAMSFEEDIQPPILSKESALANAANLKAFIWSFLVSSRCGCSEQARQEERLPVMDVPVSMDPASFSAPD